MLFIDFFFNYGHYDWYEVELIVDLICISLIINNVEHVYVSIGNPYVFFGKMSIYVFKHDVSCSCFADVLYEVAIPNMLRVLS